MKAIEICASAVLLLSAPLDLPAQTLAPKGSDWSLPAPLDLENDQGEGEEESASYGAPLSPAERTMQGQVLQGLEIPATSVPEGEDIQQWSDTQLLDFHRDEIKETASLLDSGAAAPSEQLGSVYHFSAPAVRPRLSGVTCLAIAVQGEAGGEPAAGKQAVAQTIMFRARGNPSRVCSVVFAHRQFEAMSKRPKTPSADTLRIAHSAIQREGRSCGFDYFIAKGLQRQLGRRIPAWVTNLERRGCYHKRIGSQDYYSSCNCRH